MDRDLEIHRLTARLRTLRRFGLDLCLGRMVGADDGRGRVRRAARPHRQRRAAGCWSTGAPPRPSRSSARPTPTRWAWPAAAATAGPAAGSATTGTRCSPPTGSSGHAALDDQSAFIASLGSSRSPRMRDVLGTIQADQDAIIRGGLPRRARRRRRPGHRQDGRRAAPHGVPALLRPAAGPPARRRAVRRPAPALPGVRRRRAAQPRRGGRADLHPARPACPRVRRAAVETDPEVARLKSVRGDGDGDRAGGPALRGAADARAWRSRRPGPTSGSAPTTGPRRSSRRTPARRTTRRATRSGRSCSRSWSTSTTTTRTCSADLLRSVAARRTRELRRGLRPGLAADRADRPGRRPVVGAGLPAAVRALARARRGPAAAARRTPAGVDGVRPAAAGRGPAAARRPGGVASPASRTRPRSPPSARRWTASSTHLIATDDSDMQVMSMLRGAGPARRPGRRGRRCRRPTPTCSPVRSRTSSWTRPRS